MTEDDFMFHSGDYVIYGVHGVCRVIGTEKQRVNRERVEYLVLEPLVQHESRFYLPTGNSAAMAKLQTVLSRDELCALLNSAEIRKDCWITEENLRKQYYRDLVSSADRIPFLQMVCSLYRYKDEQAAAGRKFHLCDENFLRDSEKRLCSELCLVLDMNPEQAREYLREQLRK